MASRNGVLEFDVPDIHRAVVPANAAGAAVARRQENQMIWVFLLGILVLLWLSGLRKTTFAIAAIVLLGYLIGMGGGV